MSEEHFCMSTNCTAGAVQLVLMHQARWRAVAARQRGARSPPREAPDLDIIISSFKRTFPIIFIKIICQNQCIKGEQKRRKAKFSKEEKVTTC